MVLLTVLLLAGCGHSAGRPAHPDPVPAGAATEGARVFRVKAADGLLRGPLAAAQTGDFRLENPHVAILVEGLGRPHAGAIVDAGRLPEGRDALRSLSLRLGGKRPVAVQYTRIETRMVGERAVLRLHGHHPRHPRLQILTEYRLGPQEPTLEIVTTLTSRERRALNLTASDQVDFGFAAPFAPGLGLFPAGNHELTWLTAGADGVSYGYFRRRGKIKLHLTGPIATARLGTAKLVPGGRVTFTRTLAVGGGGLGAAVLGPMLRGRGLSLSRLTVALYSPSETPSPTLR